MSGIVFLSGALLFLLLLLAFIIQNRIDEERSSQEHIKACTDPNYFKSKTQILEEENARLRQENADLAIKANKTEYR